MPKYLAKVRFTTEGLKGLREVGAVGQPPTRPQRSAAALSIAVNAGGAAKATVTKLLTAEQVDEAFKRTVAYRPPGQ